MGDQRDQTEAPFAVAPIHVDVDCIGDFRSMVGRELDANLRPGSAEVIHCHAMGVRFGRNVPDGHIDAARRAYDDVIRVSKVNLQEYVRTADLLIEAMAAVVAGYRSADHASSDGLNKLQAALSAALKSRNDLAERDRSVETTVEDHRGYAGMSVTGDSD